MKAVQITAELESSQPEIGVSTEVREYIETLDGERVDCWRVSSVERRAGSAIDQRGLFANSGIAPDTLIAIKPGRVVGSATIKENADIIQGSHQQVDFNSFLAGLTPEEVDVNLVGYNHSCEPNARILVVPGTPLAFLVTRQAVAEGEEVVADYSASQMSETHRLFACNCGTESCRQVIQPRWDWQREELQKRYAGELPPFIQKEIDRRANFSDTKLRAAIKQDAILQTTEMLTWLDDEARSEEQRVAELMRDFPKAVRAAVRLWYPHTEAGKEQARVLALREEAALLFAQFSPFSNLDDEGIYRDKPKTVTKNMDKVIAFARQLDRIFN